MASTETAGDVLRTIMPVDDADAVLLGRVWDPLTGGPRPVVVRDGTLIDAFSVGATVSEIVERDDAVEALRHLETARVWELGSLLHGWPKSTDSPRLLAPIDLQVVKACGVTHRTSLVERVAEQLAGGASDRVHAAHRDIEQLVAALDEVVPGSAQAMSLLDTLAARGIPRQYLEVGIGPDAEVFTKAPVLAAVGPGERIGVPSFSAWNNPEPELVLVCDSRGRIRGACLGNDVNLRDVEGRSALLLGRAKDNNASCALGPFVRLLDGYFTTRDLADTHVDMRVENALDGWSGHASGSTGDLLRSLDDLVAAAYGAHHQYPDGFVLLTGSLAVLTADRVHAGRGFTHVEGDVVTISSERLGTLSNTVGVAEELEPWGFGIAALMDYVGRERVLAQEGM